MYQSVNPGAEVGSGINASSSGVNSGGLTSAGVISGVTDIAKNYINSQRSKNLLNFNIGMNELQARMNRLAVNKRIADIRKRASEVYSAQKAGYAKAGISLDSTSAIAMMLESQKEADLDIIYEEINADYGQSVFNTQSGIYGMQRDNLKYDFAQDTGKSILKMSRKHYERG